MPVRLYALMDVAKTHFWTGESFLPVADWRSGAGPIACFSGRASAEVEQEGLHREREIQVRVVRLSRARRRTRLVRDLVHPSLN